MWTQARLTTVLGESLSLTLRSFCMFQVTPLGARQTFVLRIHLDLRPRQLAATAASIDQLLMGTTRITARLRSEGRGCLIASWHAAVSQPTFALSGALEDRQGPRKVEAWMPTFNRLPNIYRISPRKSGLFRRPRMSCPYRGSPIVDILVFGSVQITSMNFWNVLASSSTCSSGI